MEVSGQNEGIDVCDDFSIIFVVLRDFVAVNVSLGHRLYTISFRFVEEMLCNHTMQ